MSISKLQKYKKKLDKRAFRFMTGNRQLKPLSIKKTKPSRYVTRPDTGTYEWVRDDGSTTILRTTIKYRQYEFAGGNYGNMFITAIKTYAMIDDDREVLVKQEYKGNLDMSTVIMDWTGRMNKGIPEYNVKINGFYVDGLDGRSGTCRSGAWVKMNDGDDGYVYWNLVTYEQTEEEPEGYVPENDRDVPWFEFTIRNDDELRTYFNGTLKPLDNFDIILNFMMKKMWDGATDESRFNPFVPGDYTDPQSLNVRGRMREMRVRLASAERRYTRKLLKIFNSGFLDTNTNTTTIDETNTRPQVTLPDEPLIVKPLLEMPADSEEEVFEDADEEGYEDDDIPLGERPCDDGSGVQVIDTQLNLPRREPEQHYSYSIEVNRFIYGIQILAKLYDDDLDMLTYRWVFTRGKYGDGKSIPIATAFQSPNVLFDTLLDLRALVWTILNAPVLSPWAP